MTETSHRFANLNQLSRRSVLGGIGFGTLFAGMPGLAWAQTAARFPRLQAIVDDYVKGKKVAGMVAALGLGDAPLEAAMGGTIALGSNKPADLDTLYRLYSQTKPVTGVAIMMLIEDGLISLDTPLAEIHSGFAEMRVLSSAEGELTDTVAADKLITIRHLLTHTAGLGYTIISKGPIQKAYLDNGINPGQVSKARLPGIDVGAPTPDIQTFMDRLATLPLVYQPGTRWSYSISIDVLGYVVEKVSGKPLETFLSERMFTPLGMTNSFFQVPANRVADFADNYAVFGGTLLPIDPASNSIYLEKPAFAFGGAGLVASARDYDKFLHMLMNFGELNGTRIMTSETARTAMSNLLPDGVSLEGTWMADSHFGAGGRVGKGTPTSPAGSFGWGGAAGTAGFVDTNLRFRAGGYTQYMPSNSYPFQADFPKYVYEELIAAATAEAA